MFRGCFEEETKSKFFWNGRQPLNDPLAQFWFRCRPYRRTKEAFGLSKLDFEHNPASWVKRRTSSNLGRQCQPLFWQKANLFRGLVDYVPSSRMFSNERFDPAKQPSSWRASVLID